MRAKQFITETATTELANNLHRHNHGSLDKLMKSIAARHNLTDTALRALFIKKYKKSPESRDQHGISEEGQPDSETEQIHDFAMWAIETLHIQRPYPTITVSRDTEEAQTNHHTGQNIPGDNQIWVYVKNRNLVDIFRTIFHELVHTRQSQLGMIKPGCSYPGSPVEAMADMLAGKYIKIYGEQHHEIFQ